MSNDTALLEMPEYVCHKKVHALRITGLEPSELDHKTRLLFESIGYKYTTVDEDFVNKHNPQIGDYYVVYKDGYASISPAEAFESGYTLVEAAKRGPEKEPPNYQQRVFEEKADLDEKRIELIRFMNTGKWGSLTTDDRADMVSQQATMLEYARLLDRRIYRIK